MTRNQKIALGCGGAGCFGLIVLTLVCAGIFIFMQQRRPSFVSVNRNYNFNTNRNANTDDTVNENENSSNDNTAPRASTSMSDDDRHKLFLAASMTSDFDLVHRVNVKLGLMTEDNSPTDQYTEFLKDHFTWSLRNTDFIQSLNTAEKARDYVNQHIND
jgi:hypothetical protein